MATYYVKNGGSDSNTGLSDAQAWETIAKVNGFSFNAGDDVYFKCGDTWNNANLVVDWSGVDGDNRSVVGAYYMNGSETAGVNIGGKPVLDSGWDLVTQGGGDIWEVTIKPYSVGYVTIQDIKVINSHGHGVAALIEGPCNNMIVRRVHVDNVGYNGIDSQYFGADALIEYCKVEHDNLKYSIGEVAHWGGGIKINGNNSICRYSEVSEGHGEGINVSSIITGQYLIVENNLVWSRWSVGIYLGCCPLDSTVRNNIVIGTTNPDYQKLLPAGGRRWNTSGIGLNQELSGKYTHRNKIYNNVVIGCSAGIGILNKSGGAVGGANRNYIYNNTLIDNWSNIYTHPSEEIDAEFKNNLSYLSSEAVALGCTHVAKYQNVGATDVYRPLGNFWSSTPQYAVWEHASDVVGDPKFSRTSGWLSISEPNDIDISASMAILDGSDAIDAALNLGAQDDYGASWDFGAYINTGAESPTHYTRFRGTSRPKPKYRMVGGRFR